MKRPRCKNLSFIATWPNGPKRWHACRRPLSEGELICVECSLAQAGATLDLLYSLGAP